MSYSVIKNFLGSLALNVQKLGVVKDGLNRSGNSDYDLISQEAG